MSVITKMTPPKGGMGYQRAQLTKLTHSKVLLNCDHCGIVFEKYACWAKRSANHYCGRACANAAKIVRIPKPCAVCGIEMLLTPYDINRVSACSKPCQRKRRTKNNSNLRTSPDYRAILKQVKKHAVCKACSSTKGPWVVRGIVVGVKDGLAYAEGSGAYLLCKHCHMGSVSPLALNSMYMKDRDTYYKEKNGEEFK